MQRIPFVTIGSNKFLPLQLSPMAGMTNAPFRTICSEYAINGYGSNSLKKENVFPGFFVDEMVAARAIAGHFSKVARHVIFSEKEQFRSIQLYVLDPEFTKKAAEVIAQNNLADHIDLNFGCPVKKVTSNGGGSALPLNPGKLREIVKAAKSATKRTDIILSAKFRIGKDENTEPHFLNTAQICVEEGAQMLTLHARTTKQFYSGNADWTKIKELREKMPREIVIFGNGDIFSAQDARRMFEETGCDGVAIGRGALGRPWIFEEIGHFLKTGEILKIEPEFKVVRKVMIEHLNSLVDFFAARSKVPSRNQLQPDEILAVRCFRASIGGYLKGYPVGSEMKVKLMQAKTRDELFGLLNLINSNSVPVDGIAHAPRGRTKASNRVVLPQNWE